MHPRPRPQWPPCQRFTLNHGFECDEISLPPEGDILDEGIGSTAGCVAVNGKSRSCKSSFGYEVVSGCGAPEPVFLD